jgi:hypothetical protein
LFSTNIQTRKHKFPSLTIFQKSKMFHAPEHSSLKRIPFSQTSSIKQLFDTVQATRKSLKFKQELKPIPQQQQEEFRVVDKSERSSSSADQKLVVKTIVAHLTSILEETSVLAEFEGKNLPSISLSEYVDRLIRYVDAWAGESPSITSVGIRCALMAVEYIDRLEVPISSRSIHRLMMCAVLVAVKFTEDFAISNRFWAKVGGIDLEEMNRMEFAFCKLLNWKFSISREDFESQRDRFAE